MADIIPVLNDGNAAAGCRHGSSDEFLVGFTKRSQAVFDLPADFRLALSGTPVENRLAELWSIMRFANPRLESPRAESELKALRNLLAPACEKVVGAYAEVANHKSAERAFKRFLQNMISAT